MIAFFPKLGSYLGCKMQFLGRIQLYKLCLPSEPLKMRPFGYIGIFQKYFPSGVKYDVYKTWPVYQSYTHTLKVYPYIDRQTQLFLF